MWSVIVVAKGMWDTTKACLDTMLATTDRRLDLIYIDNGTPVQETTWSAMSEWAYVHSLPVKMRLFYPGVPLAKAWNEGVNLACGDRVLICNNDLVFHRSGWLEEFDKALDDQSVGVVGIIGMSWCNTSFIQGSVFGFRRDCFGAVYSGPEILDGKGPSFGFDERYLFTCEEVDWCKRLQLLGYSIKPLEHLRNEYIQHLEGATRNHYKDNTIEMQRQAHISRLEYRYRWTYPAIEIHD